MQINFFPKIIFLFIGIVLLSPKLHAEVQVLCLGEGECVTLENYVHPGSLSGASTDQKLEYLKWYQDQFNSSIDINESIIKDIEAGNGTKDDLKTLNEYINKMNNSIDKDSDSDGGSSPSDDLIQECKDNPLDNPELCEGLAPNEYALARCKAEPQEGCPGFLPDPGLDPAIASQLAEELRIIIEDTVDVGSVTELSSTGGSGEGEVAYSAEGKCAIEDKIKLKASDEEGICTINANKGSEVSSVTITVAAVDIVDHQTDDGCFSKSWGPLTETSRLGEGTTFTCTCSEVDNRFPSLEGTLLADGSPFNSRAGKNFASTCEGYVFLPLDKLSTPWGVVGSKKRYSTYTRKCTPEGIAAFQQSVERVQTLKGIKMGYDLPDINSVQNLFETDCITQERYDSLMENCFRDTALDSFTVECMNWLRAQQ